VSQAGSDGPAAGAHVAVIVVDEAVLALTGYTVELQQMINAFYAKSRNSLSLCSSDTRASVVVFDLVALEEMARLHLAQEIDDVCMSFGMGGGMMKFARRGPMAMMCMQANLRGGSVGGGGGGDDEPDNSVIAVRSNFNPQAAFQPILLTDADGCLVFFFFFAFCHSLIF
jgi:hypothetical protein